MMDYAAEQAMEIEALEAILMDDMRELNGVEDGGFVGAVPPSYQITVSPKGDDEEEPTELPVRVALVFAHTPCYPDELPQLAVRSLQGLKGAELDELRQKLREEAEQNLGMAMMYTLATSAKEWLRARFGQEEAEEDEDAEEGEKKEEVIEAHGLPVTVETFLEWRDRYEGELALEQAKLMSDSALAAPKEQKMTGRKWFESGGPSQKGRLGVVEGEDSEEEGDEDVDFEEDFDEEDGDEEDMLQHFLATKAGETRKDQEDGG